MNGFSQTKKNNLDVINKLIPETFDWELYASIVKNPMIKNRILAFQHYKIISFILEGIL